jgi:hypothetical protein
MENLRAPERDLAKKKDLDESDGRPKIRAQDSGNQARSGKSKQNSQDRHQAYPQQPMTTAKLKPLFVWGSGHGWKSDDGQAHRHNREDRRHTHGRRVLAEDSRPYLGAQNELIDAGVRLISDPRYPD